MAALEVPVGSPAAVAGCGFSRDGFGLASWNTEADGSGAAYRPGDVIASLEDDMTLYAQWGEAAAVRFNKSVTGKTALKVKGMPADITASDGHAIGVAMELPPDAPYFTDGSRTFYGWADEYLGAAIAQPGGPYVPASAAQTLYADWGARVTLRINHPSDQASAAYGEFFARGSGYDYTVPEMPWTSGTYETALAGWAFEGWNTAADGTGDAYMPGDVIEGVADSLDLYAQWREE